MRQMLIVAVVCCLCFVGCQRVKSLEVAAGGQKMSRPAAAPETRHTEDEQRTSSRSLTRSGARSTEDRTRSDTRQGEDDVLLSAEKASIRQGAEIAELRHLLAVHESADQRAGQ
jgi:hypothetical protein